MDIRTAPEFDGWENSLSSKAQALVDARLDRIVHEDHFGDSRALGERLFELRWSGGMRVYFGYVADAGGKAALMLLGGDKNGQKRDIRKARRILARETE